MSLSWPTAACKLSHAIPRMGHHNIQTISMHWPIECTKSCYRYCRVGLNDLQLAEWLPGEMLAWACSVNLQFLADELELAHSSL